MHRAARPLRRIATHTTGLGSTRFFPPFSQSRFSLGYKFGDLPSSQCYLVLFPGVNEFDSVGHRHRTRGCHRLVRSRNVPPASSGLADRLASCPGLCPPAAGVYHPFSHVYYELTRVSPRDLPHFPPSLAAMGETQSVEEHCFNLKFTAKNLNKQASKCEANAEKAKQMVKVRSCGLDIPGYACMPRVDGILFPPRVPPLLTFPPFSHPPSLHGPRYPLSGEHDEGRQRVCAHPCGNSHSRKEPSASLPSLPCFC